ncbi:nucleoside ABC transporter ATP-binding protein [Rhizobiales bacterium GAS191]|nr:nucleoside ABC transporter ATP-binding protein [Rhizobiales bacterium GAS191]
MGRNLGRNLADPIAQLELTGITKRFGEVLANDAVNLSARKGEIKALIGENGAGKSTLVKIIYGVQHADAGEMRFEGVPVTIANPRAARRLGIGMVFQHFSLFEPMTVLENIAVGMDQALDRRALEREVRAILDAYGLPLDIHRYVDTLSVGERQRIEIVRCLLQKPKLLIMDEPTSVLTPQEADQLFDTLRQLASQGCTVLYISHKLNEIKALCESATILRGGRVVGECDPRAETQRRIAELMIGAELRNVERPEGRSPGAARLEVQHLSLASDEPFGVDLEDISFAARGGEILGIAGVAGNGQKELMLALSGEIPASNASAIRLDGIAIGSLPPPARRQRGLCALPEERNGHAAVVSFSLAENTLLTARERRKLSTGGVIRGAAMRDYARAVIEAFKVKATGQDAPARSLSGGNLQKFVVGREIMQEPLVLAVDQPTWGVDAGAAAAIRQALVDLAARGSAVIVVSQDLDELLSLCDRLAVMNEGRLSEPLIVGEASIEQIGLLMGGVHGVDAARADEEASHAA